MNTSIVHETGTLLLGVEDVQFMDNSFQAPNASGAFASNMMASTLGPIGEGAATDSFHGPADDDDDDVDFGGDDGGGWCDDDDMATEVRQGNGGPTDSTALQQADLNANAREESDAWEPLDAFDAGAAVAKSTFRKIKSYRIPSHLSESGSQSKKTSLRSLPLCPISEFCAQAFSGLSTRNMPKGIRAPEYLEFAQFYSAEHKRRNTAVRKAGAAEKAQEQLAEEARAAELQRIDPLELSAVPLNMSADDDADDDYGMFDEADNGDDYDAPADVQFDDVEATGLGAEIQDGMADEPDYMAAHSQAAAVTYEDLVRRHIDAYIAETQKYAVETDLSKRLEEWEDKIRPALVAESKRDQFDIHAYGATVMGKFNDENIDRKKFAPFEKLANTQDAFEISRMFLATLQLANAGNVAIKSGKSCNMEIKLLDTTTHYSKFEAALAPMTTA